MIAMLGADVIRVRGSYEDALDESVRQSRRKGWILVSDTGFIGSDEIPIRILSAYQIIAKELENAGLSSASHLFVQAGTGGLAASLCAFFWERLGKFRPRLTVVESDVAACLLESCRERRRVRIEGPHNTVMAGLACGEPSTVAWDILASGADAFAAVGDREVTEVVQDLAAGVYGTRCAAGESGAAGLCALRLMASHPANRSELGISADSVLLTIGTDGPLSSFTDPGAALVIK
jgi:diaminopropionate ammonia-lyase